MSGSAEFRTTAKGRADLIEAAKQLRIKMANARAAWRGAHAPAPVAALGRDDKDQDAAEALEPDTEWDSMTYAERTREMVDHWREEELIERRREGT